MVCARISNTDTIAPFSVSMKWLIIELHCNLTGKKSCNDSTFSALFQKLVETYLMVPSFLVRLQCAIQDSVISWLTQLKKGFFWCHCSETRARVIVEGNRTWSMTSTSYWLPFDFWCPTNLDPLYNNEFVTPGCLDLMGGKGGATFISVGMLRTGILIDLWRKRILEKYCFSISFNCHEM